MDVLFAVVFSIFAILAAGVLNPCNIPSLSLCADDERDTFLY